MPISLNSLNRRDFLKATLAAGAGGLVSRPAFAASDGADPHRFALLADTHIPANATITLRGVNMTENLRRVVGEVCALTDRPAATLVGGDCAVSKGLSEDYAHLVGLLEPLRNGGMPVHLALGNHDNRERFLKVLAPQDAAQNTALDRHLTVVESPRANWILLDSLRQTNETPGTLGEAQRNWLAKTLDARQDRPALIVVHHQPDPSEDTNGLTDTAELMAVILPRKQVKAVIFGHTHDWHLRQRDGLHLINLPPVAYVFGKDRPNGWIDARLEETGATLQLQCLDPKHPLHGEKKPLQWRTR